MYRTDKTHIFLRCTGLGSKDEDGTWQCVGCSAKRPPANNPPPSSSTATITPKIPTPEPPIKPTVAPAPLAPPGTKVAKKVKQAVIRPVPRGSRGRGGGRGSSWSVSRRGRTTPPILKPVIPRPSSAQQQEHERLFSCVEAAAAQLPDGIVLDQEASTFYIGGGEELSLAQMLSVLCRAEKGEVPTRKTPLGIQQLSGLEEGSLKVFAFRAEGGGPVESEGWRRDGLSETGGKGKCDVRVQRFQAGFSAFERASDLSSSDSDFRRRGVWTSADPSLVAVQYTVLRRRQSEKKQEEVSPQPQLRIKILASTPKEDEDEDDIVVEEEFPAGRSCTPLSVSPIEAAGTPRSRERERMLLKLPKSTTIALERQGKGVEGSASQPEVQVLAPEKKPRSEVINIESEEEREDGCDDIIVCGEEEARAKLPPKPPSYQRKLPPGIVCTRVARKQQHEPRKEIPVVTAAASTPPTLTGSQETAPKLVVVATASLPPATPEKSKEVPERRPSPVSSVSKQTPPTPAKKKNPPSISPRSDSRSSSSDISVKKKRVPARKGLEDIRKRFKAEMLQQLRRRSRDISEEEQQEGPPEKRAEEEDEAEAPPKPIFEEKMEEEEEGGGSRQPEQIASSSPTPLSPPPPPEQKSASAVGNEGKDEKAEAESGGSSKTMMHAAQEEKDEKAKPENSDDRSDKEGEEEADGVVRISIPREELDTLKRLGFSILD